MKYFLILLFLFTLGCKNNYEAKYDSIKYGDKFTVKDSFYGDLNCTVYEKRISYFFSIYYYVIGACVNDTIYKKLAYDVKDIKLEKDPK